MERDPLRPKYDWRIPRPCPLGPGKHDMKKLEASWDFKFWLGSKAAQQNGGYEKLANRFNVTVDYVFRLKKAVMKDTIVFNSKGRPPLINADQKKELQKLKSDGGFDKSLEKVKKDVVVMAQTNCKLRGDAEYVVEKISDRSFNRLVTSLGLKKGQANQSTLARDRACSDLRNAVSFAAMIGYIDTIVPVHLKFNVDATQFELGDNSKAKQTVLYSEKSRALKAEAPERPEGITCYFIKSYILICAFGVAAPPL